MSSCYLCGRKIPDGTGVRREVATGESRTIGFFGKRVGGSASEHYGFRLICQQCDTSNFVSGVANSIAKFIIGGIVIICLLVYDKCGSSSDSAADYKKAKASVDALMLIDTTKIDAPVVKRAIHHKKHHKQAAPDSETQQNSNQ